MTGTDTLPLTGVRVLDLTQNVAGPYGTMILADLGAEVIKLERPDKGDDSRQWGPPNWRDGQSAVFLALNHGKRSLSLDLKEPVAQEIMRQLVATSDVLIESFRPGVMDRLGFGYEWARSVNPALIYVSISAFGNTGPLRDLPGYDPLMQAFGGLMSVTGEAGRPPVRVGCSIMDMGTGMWAAMAVLSALLRRHHTGQGIHIGTSLYETALAWVQVPLASYWATGEVPEPLGSGVVGIVPYRAFPVRDGHVVIAAGNDRLFLRLCDLLHHPEWAADPRFATNPARVQHRALLDDLIAKATGGRQAAEFLKELSARGIPCAPIRDIAAVAGDEQARALAMFQSAETGVPPGYRSVALPMVLGEERPHMRLPPPALGQHNAEILAELGYSPAEVVELLGVPALQTNR